MKIVQSNYNIIQEPSLTKKIERVGRLCYKSQDKICEGSDKKFVNNLVKRKHLAMLEHGDIIVQVDEPTYNDVVKSLRFISDDLNKEDVSEVSYLKSSVCDGRYLISGNMRAWFELIPMIAKYVDHVSFSFFDTIINASEGILEKYEDLFKYNKFGDTRIIHPSQLGSREKLLHERLTVDLICDRGVSHEIVRHRPCSFAQESTRYCNYSLDKYDNQISFIEPFFFKEDKKCYEIWQNACLSSEKDYLNLIELGAKPEEARTVLNNSLKTEIIVTANLLEWLHIFDLRVLETTGPAHPQIKELLSPFYEEFKYRYPVVMQMNKIERFEQE